MTAQVQLSVPVAVGAERVWRAVTDWERQGEWMLGTRVTLTGGDGRSVGSTLRAVTGFGPAAFTDTMEITEWHPARMRCVVRHTGHLVRGDGEFAVTEASPGGSSVLHWTERLELPFGALGRLGWPVARPAFVAGLRLSLRRFARLCVDDVRGAR